MQTLIRPIVNCFMINVDTSWKNFHDQHETRIRGRRGEVSPSGHTWASVLVLSLPRVKLFLRQETALLCSVSSLYPARCINGNVAGCNLTVDSHSVQRDCSLNILEFLYTLQVCCASQNIGQILFTFCHHHHYHYHLISFPFSLSLLFSQSSCALLVYRLTIL